MTVLLVVSNYTLTKESYKHIIIIIAGILAGVRPCGIIVLLAELFRAESISQVYGTLHEFLTNHQHVLEKLGTRIIY